MAFSVSAQKINYGTQETLRQEDFSNVLAGRNSLATVSTLVLGFVVALQSSKVNDFMKDMQEKDTLRIVGVVGGTVCCAASTGMVMVASLGFSFQGYFGTDLMAYSFESAKKFVYSPDVLQNTRVSKLCLMWGTLLFGVGLACEALAKLSFSGNTEDSDGPSATTSNDTSTETYDMQWVYGVVFTICILSPLMASLYVMYAWRMMDGMRGTFMQEKLKEDKEREQYAQMQAEQYMPAAPMYAGDQYSQPDLMTSPLIDADAPSAAPPVEDVKKEEWFGLDIGTAVVVTFPDDEAKQSRLGLISSEPDEDWDCLVRMIDGSRETNEVVNYDQLFLGLSTETRVHVGDKIGRVTTAEVNAFIVDRSYVTPNHPGCFEKEFILKSEGSTQKCRAKFSDITSIDTTDLKRPYVSTCSSSYGRVIVFDANASQRF